MTTDGETTAQQRDTFNEVRTVDHQFFDALLRSDTHALEQVLHPRFVIVDVGEGNVTSRFDFISAVEARLVTFKAIEVVENESFARELGDCVAVVGRTAMLVHMPGGGSLTTDSRYTHLFCRNSSGAWQLASAQGTAIPPTRPADL